MPEAEAEAPSGETAHPASPRSPRPNAGGLPMPGGEPMAGLPPGMFIAPPPPRPNLGSLLFMAAWFFFMSGGNNMPQTIIVGPDGTIQPRQTELGLARDHVAEYQGYLNGTGNWSQSAQPEVLPSSLIPSEYDHQPTTSFFTNITGFYRDARTHPVNLLSSSPSSTFFHDIPVPQLNTTTIWNDTVVSELRGEWDFQAVDKWGMNVKERHVHLPNTTDWSWVKGSATLSAGENSIDYSFLGLHYLPNGTMNLYALPDGMRIDVRNIPRLYPDHQNTTHQIILAELERELATQESNLLLTDVQDDDLTATKCPLLIYLTLPHIPLSTSSQAVELYEQELHDPTGIRWSLPRPPEYWEGRGLGGVAIADQCGWAFGIEGGRGSRLDDFWRKSINYAAFASASQLLVLLLLVRQMEATRTPSTLAKVSVQTVIMMGISDSWVFSAHVVMGIVSENKTSMPMLIPGFFCLCTAIVFVPRYAVLLHRIQAPERVTTPPTPTPRISATSPTTPGQTNPTAVAVEEDSPSMMERFRTGLANNRGLRFAGAMLLMICIFNLAFIPPIVPFFLFVMYSFWIPQIWRNARRGNSHALDHRFVLGTSIGRLALPLYIFACPDNVFFLETSKWVWGLVVWQWAQIVIMYAQERFGPAFFLPKRFAPVESYNYHPLLPPIDLENPTSDAEKVCSICMEEVDTRPGPSGEVLLGMNPRRAYALAPCHHLFHTKCLSQWLAIKTICPLCKRSLPPL